MLTIKKQVGFTTDYNAEVDSMVLEFSNEDLQKIRKHQAYLEQNPDVFKVAMWFDAELLDCDGDEADFRTQGGGELFIFKNSLYYMAQCKYDSSVVVESAEITNKEIYGDNPPYLNPISEAKEMLRKEGYFTQNLWTSDDIIGTASNMDKEITEEQAIEIMDLMGRRFDASIGVNWDFIETIIDEYLNA